MGILNIERNKVIERYLKEIAKTQPLSPEEEAALTRRIKKGDMRARDKLITSNLRFVVSIASHYQGYGISFADLIAQGNMGLISAAERFDETKGFKFISYAVWWIRQAILQYMGDNSRVVRIPQNRTELMRKIFKYSKLRIKDGIVEPPSPEDIAEALDVSVEMVRDTLKLAKHPVSLDAEFGEGDERSLLQILRDTSHDEPDDIIDAKGLSRAIADAFARLDEREREVLRLYFGLHGCEHATLEAIGARFNLSRERIRQIKEKALQKLRRRANLKLLKPFADGIDSIDAGILDKLDK